MSLTNLPLRQQHFDTVLAHLRKQGKRSTYGNRGCAYRGTDNTKCAIGALLPDELYDPKMENRPVDNLLVNFPEIAREEDSVVATYTTTLVEAGLMSRSSAILKNKLDFKEEMARMVNDSIELAKSISTAKAAMKASGLKDDIINEIVNKTFMTVIVPDPTKMQDANKNPNN